MKKRILSIVLILCMVFMLMPTVALASEVTVTTEEELRAAVQTSGTINLGADIALSEPLIVNDPAEHGFNLTLNMNGHTLTGVINLTACSFTLNGRLDADVEAKAYVDPSNQWPSWLDGGTYAGQVRFKNTAIMSGIFLNKVSGQGSIAGGTFYEDVNCRSVAGGSFFKSCTTTDSIWAGIFYGAYNQDKVAADCSVRYNSDDEVHAIEFADTFASSSVLGAEAPSKKGYTFLGWYEKDTNGEFLETPMEFPFSSDNLRRRTIDVYALWAPVISGVEDGKTYCTAQTVTVLDNDAVRSVTVNDEPITLENNQFTLNPAEGTQTIVVTDKAGNVFEITVTVNDGHTYEWKSENGQYWKKCKFCGDETAKKDIPEITIDAPDKVCRTQDCEVSLLLPENIVHAEVGYEFIGCGDGLNTTVEDGRLHGVLPASVYPDVENAFDLVVYARTDDGFLFIVKKNVVIQNEHAGGVATCVELAICDTCGEHYGEIDSTNHDIENIPAKDATAAETGNKEYWHCKDCGKCFTDENGTQEIALAELIIPKLPPEIIKGAGQSTTEGERMALSFTSNAAYSDFIRVEIDGKTLDEKDYTVEEGSTVVTLNADYVATLSGGKYTIGIVSESGTATTTFTVEAKAIVGTGDNSHIALWIALVFVSGAGAIVTTVCGKKRKAE